MKKTEVGYTGGTTVNPSYESVCSGRTRHAEAVQLTFDPKLVSYEHLLKVFWSLHSATFANQTHGGQYRSAVFYHSPEQAELARQAKQKLQLQLGKTVFTEITPATTFYRAEEYHQDYYKKNRVGICR